MRLTPRQALARGDLFAGDGRLLVYSSFDRYADAVGRFHKANPSYGPSSPLRRAVDLAMGRSARKFGETAAVSRARVRLRAGAPLLRVSHQPNVLAALSIIGLALLQRDLATAVSWEGVPPVIVFACVDHDAAGDRRFRSPRVPAWDRKGLVSLGGAVPKRDHDRPPVVLPPLDPLTLERWFSTMEQSTMHWGSRLQEFGGAVAEDRECRRRLRETITSLKPRLEASDNLGEAARAMISQLLNGAWGLDVLCVSESELLPMLSEELVDLLGRGRFGDRGCWLWRVCPTCLKRRIARVTLGARGRPVAAWTCQECAVGEARERIDFARLVGAPGRQIPAFLPRVEVEDEIDLCIYRAIGGVTYAGGVGHLVHHRESQPPATLLPPEFSWEPKRLILPHDPGTEPSLQFIDSGRCPFPLYEAWRTEPGGPPAIRKPPSTDLSIHEGREHA